jgi:hypothetical protein
LAAIAVRIGNTKIVLGVLIEVFSGNWIATCLRLPCERDISLEDLPGATTNPDSGAVALKVLAALRPSPL